MIKKSLAVLLTAPLLVFTLALPGRSYAADPTVCTDGTISKATGSGACSGHGGVQKATKAPAAAPATRSTMPPANAPELKSAAAEPSADMKETPLPTVHIRKGDPPGATAKCKDGTYSKSTSRSGTCSRHRGVALWLTSP